MEDYEERLRIRRKEEIVIRTYWLKDFHYNQDVVTHDNDGYYPEFPRYLREEEKQRNFSFFEKKTSHLPFLEQSNSSKLTNWPISGDIY